MTRPVEQFETMHYSKKQLIRELVRGYTRDAKETLGADLHNAKNDPSWTSRLAPLFKRYGLRTPEDVIQFIANRWKTVAAD